MGSAVTEFSALNLEDLRKMARKLGVLVKDADKNWRSRSEIIEDCRRAINISPVEETVGAAPGHASASMDSSPSKVANAQGLESGNDASASVLAEGPGLVENAVNRPAPGGRPRSFAEKLADKLRKRKPEAKEAAKLRMRKPEAKEAAKLRMGKPEAKEAAKLRMGKPEAKEAAKLRKGKPEAKAQDRMRKRDPLVREENRKQKAQRVADKKRAERAERHRARARRQLETVHTGGC